MPPKQRIPEEATPAPLAPPRCHSHASKIPATNTEVNLKPEPHAPKILWDLNKHWTDQLIKYLSDNLDVQLKMFSDSIKDARKESHRKVSNLMFWFFCADCCLRLSVANLRLNTTVQLPRQSLMLRVSLSTQHIY